MEALAKGWFSEVGLGLWPGQCFSLEVEKELVKQRSKFQDVLMFQSKTWGKVLVLDGTIQVTERDQFAYAEMITHVPLFAHPNPKHVLMVGGGDGAAVTEILKHKTVESVDFCEIDQLVKDVSKEHYPQYAPAFTSPKVNHTVEDGFVFLKSKEKSYDVIVVDSSDPIGPAESLFQAEFYQLLKKSLKDGGIICTQGESMWLHLDIIKKLKDDTKGIFKNWNYATMSIPTYPCGQIGLVVAGDISPLPSRGLETAFDKDVADTLKYYSTEVHKAAFVLPPFVLKALN